MAQIKKLATSSQRNESRIEKEKREQLENEINSFKDLNTDVIPAYLNEIGSDEWTRIVPLLKNLPISDLDRATVALYCKHYETFVEASQILNEEGYTLESKNRDGSTTRKENPVYRIMTTSGKEVQSLANKLGLNITSRIQIVGAEVEKEDKVDDPFAKL